MIQLTKYTCIDKNCKFYHIIRNTERKFIYGHLVKKPKQLLDYLAEQHGIISEPWIENKWTVINAIIDYCHELAIKISDEEDSEEC